MCRALTATIVGISCLCSPAFAQTEANFDRIVAEVVAEANKAVGDTSVDYARLDRWLVTKDKDSCSLGSADVYLSKHKDAGFVAISFSPKTPMPIKEGDKFMLRLSFLRLSERGVHQTPERSFRAIDLDGISIHGGIPLSMLDNFARYEWGGFVFGKGAVLQRIDLVGSAVAVAKFKECLAEIGV